MNENVFMKIPNGVIKVSSNFDHFLLPTYITVRKRKGVFGDSVGSIESFKSLITLEGENKYRYNEEMLCSLGLLSSEVVDDDGLIHFDPILKVSGYEDILNYAEISYKEAKQVFKDMVRETKKRNRLFFKEEFSIQFIEENLQENYTPFTFDEYQSFTNYIPQINKNRLTPRKSTREWRGCFGDLFNIYFTIKAYINFAKNTNSKNATFRIAERMSCAQIANNTNYSKTAIAGIISELLDMGLIERRYNPKYDKTPSYTLPKKEEKENEKDGD